MGDEIVELLKGAARDLGRDLVGDLKELSRFAGEKAKELAAARDESGFELALRAARNAVALRAGIAAVDAADAADARLLGLLEGALGIAGRVV